MGPAGVVLHFRPSVNRENGFKLGDQHHVVIIYIYIYIYIIVYLFLLMSINIFWF